MSNPNKQTAAQREAKRLYKVFRYAADYDYMHERDIEQIAKESAIIATSEAEKQVLTALTRTVYDLEYKAELKKHYRDVRREIKKL